MSIKSAAGHNTCLTEFPVSLVSFSIYHTKPKKRLFREGLKCSQIAHWQSFSPLYVALWFIPNLLTNSGLGGLEDLRGCFWTMKVMNSEWNYIITERSLLKRDRKSETWIQTQWEYANKQRPQRTKLPIGYEGGVLVNIDINAHVDDLVASGSSIFAWAWLDLFGIAYWLDCMTDEGNLTEPLLI